MNVPKIWSTYFIWQTLLVTSCHQYTARVCVWGLHRCNKQANTKWQLIAVRLTLTCYSSPKRWSNTQFSSCSTWKVSRFLDGGRQTHLFHSYLHWISLCFFFFLGTHTTKQLLKLLNKLTMSKHENTQLWKLTKPSRSY